VAEYLQITGLVQHIVILLTKDRHGSKTLVGEQHFLEGSRGTDWKGSRAASWTDTDGNAVRHQACFCVENYICS